MQRFRAEAMDFAKLGLYRYKLSGEVLAMDQGAAQESLADDTRTSFLHKPFRASELLDGLRQALHAP